MCVYSILEKIYVKWDVMLTLLINKTIFIEAYFSMKIKVNWKKNIEKQVHVT